MKNHDNVKAAFQIALMFFVATNLNAAVEWAEGFEAPGSIPGWTVEGSSNVWAKGSPTSGPGGAHSGTNCVATILNGNYPNSVDARLISPEFVVPAAIGQPALEVLVMAQYAGSGRLRPSAGTD